MAIYYMNSKTFLKEFIKLDAKQVLNTQYVVISNSIKRNGDFKNVITGNSLYPSGQLLCRLEEEDDREEFEEEYLEELSNNDPFFATLIKYAIEQKYTIVFLCSKFEDKKLGYLDIIAKYVKKRFGYPIYKYDVVKKDKKKIEYNKEKTLKKCNKVLNDAKEAQLMRKMRTVQGRREILAEMTKDDMKKELKRRGLYYKNMTKHEMKDTLKAFFVEE